MRIVIVGAGKTGTQLAKHLIQEKHDVSIIEAGEEAARDASNRLDCLVIHDEGNNLKTLAEAGIAKADALICVTGSDEVNMIICNLAASQFSQRPETRKLVKIARIRNDDYINLSKSGDKQILGIDHFIHPGMEAAKSIIRTVEHGVMGDVVSISDTSYELGSVDITAGSVLDGLALADYRSTVPEESLVTLVMRHEEALLPSGSTILQAGDRVYILADKNNLPRIFERAGNVKKPIRKIGIVGGGKLGSLVAEGLLRGFNTEADAISGGAKDQLAGIWHKTRKIFSPLLKSLRFQKNRRVLIIEQDYRICKELSTRFPEALILNQDISDESFVNEEQLDDLDLLITTTNNQELNIITAVYLKSRGIQRAIAMVTGSGYAAMARHLGVDVVVPMKSVVVASILSRLTSSGIKEVRQLGDGAVDIIDIDVGEGALLLDKPISQLKFTEGGLVMLVNRGSYSFIPRGDYIFCKGDRIIMITKPGSQAEIDKYFGVEK